MKIGYTIWSVGWLCLAVGIGMITWGVIVKEGFIIGRGIVFIVATPLWLKWGRDKIQKAVLRQLAECPDNRDVAK